MAPKLLEIDGQASENSTPVSVSSTFCDGLCTCTVPFSMRISENAATRTAPLFWLRISVSIRPDQLVLPSGSTSMAMIGRSSATSEISTRPVSSGTKRSRAVSRSAVSAGRLASPSVTSAKLTLPVGNNETVTTPPSVGLSPVTEWISLNTWRRTASAEMRNPAAT